MKVRKIMYNWRQIGSITDRDGTGKDYEILIVGVNGVKSIVEHKPIQEDPRWSYVVEFKNGITYRIFNPNFVEYSTIENER